MPSVLNWTTRDHPWFPRQMLWTNILGLSGDGGVGLGAADAGLGGGEADVGRSHRIGTGGRADNLSADGTDEGCRLEACSSLRGTQGLPKTKSSRCPGGGVLRQARPQCLPRGIGYPVAAQIGRILTEDPG